jgi:hypothetical protein
MEVIGVRGLLFHRCLQNQSAMGPSDRRISAIRGSTRTTKVVIEVPLLTINCGESIFRVTNHCILRSTWATGPC